ncbi:2Fe-2S iron-sulfur cluster-binding protein [Streptomyces desertarenae]|uniref:2Fe-2S iron-sulfur cluster-binding protein n=1 Tax=Streptomyces desertarenae TaxID=2666184 RepID=A0ABW4PNF3_9ACTN
MSNDQQRPFQPDHSGRPVPPPEGGWGGEHDGDATAFIQLPGDLPGPYPHGYADGSGSAPDPLAAPGTGQGWAPPALDPRTWSSPAPEQEPVTPAATTDPAAPGQWTMPFAPAAPAGSGPGEPAVGQDTAPPQPRAQAQPPGAAASLGQGAAAALAGSHEARERQRRPLGEGPAVPEQAPQYRPEEYRPQEQAPGTTPPPGADWNAVPSPAATGQWSIPFAAAGSPDDSGEYLAAAAAAGRPAEPPAPETAGPVPPHASGGDGDGGESPGAADPGTGSEEARDAAPGEHPAPDGAPQEAGPQAEPDGAPQAVPEPAAGQPGPDAAGAAPEPAPGQPQEHAALPEPPAPEAPAAEAPVPEPAAVDSEHPHVSYTLRVNGVDRPVTDAWIGESLLYVLRERLGLAGAKDGCSQGECGACSVQVDGRLVASCLVPAATTAGSEVRTVEGLAENGTPCDVQRALAACGAVQCGFCVPGMAMTLHDLLEGNHAPTELEARQAVSGNLCRCSGYRGVLDAVRTVVAEREAAAAVAAEAREAGAEAGDAGGARIRIPHQTGPAFGGPHHDHHLPQDGGAQ